MNYCLFLGHRYGYKALPLFLKKKADVKRVVIEQEFEHEAEKYDKKIIELCESHGVQYSLDLSREAVMKNIVGDYPDIIFVYGYRRLIPKEAYGTAKHAMALHYSLLPQYRGFAPVNWAIINGEKETGISLFYLDEEADSGDIILQRSVEISAREDINDVLEKCDEQALELISEGIDLFEQGIFPRMKQDNTLATYACSRSPEDGKINWEDTAENICNLIRAITRPFPCAYTFWENEKISIIDAEVFPVRKYVGIVCGRIIQIIDGRGVVALAGQGAVLVKHIVKDNMVMTADKLCRSVRKKFK